MEAKNVYEVTEHMLFKLLASPRLRGSKQLYVSYDAEPGQVLIMPLTDTSSKSETVPEVYFRALVSGSGALTYWFRATVENGVAVLEFTLGRMGEIALFEQSVDMLTYHHYHRDHNSTRQLAGVRDEWK